MKRITLALALALAAGCQASPDLSTEEQALQIDYCETVGQPLPPVLTWAGEPLYLTPGSVAILGVGQGTYTAYGVDLKHGEVKWAREIPPGDLPEFHDTMALAGTGVFVRPLPLPCCNPPVGEELRYLLGEALHVAAVADFPQHMMVCAQP